MPSFVPRYFLDRYLLSIAAYLDFFGQQGLWADKAHITSEDVPELGQFVHRRGSHEPSYSRDPSIAVSCLERTELLVRIDDHRSNLPVHESASALADALLRIEGWAAVIELDRDHDRDPDRCRHHHPEASEGRVEGTFEELASLGIGPDSSAVSIRAEAVADEPVAIKP
jgi:hypothetical protein